MPTSLTEQNFAVFDNIVSEEGKAIRIQERWREGELVLSIFLDPNSGGSEVLLTGMQAAIVCVAMRDYVDSGVAPFVIMSCYGCSSFSVTTSGVDVVIGFVSNQSARLGKPQAIRLLAALKLFLKYRAYIRLWCFADGLARMGQITQAIMLYQAALRLGGRLDEEVIDCMAICFNLSEPPLL